MLEGQNQMLQGKLESQEFQAKIRAMTEGSSVEKFKEENRALLKRLKEAEGKAQIANDKVNDVMMG
jgi:predicted  nucleic acid-binding Zn-ribbon protein